MVASSRRQDRLRDWWNDLPVFLQEALRLSFLPVCAVGLVAVAATRVAHDGRIGILALSASAFFAPVLMISVNTYRRSRNSTLYIWDAGRGLEQRSRTRSWSKISIPLAIVAVPGFRFLPHSVMTAVLAAAAGLTLTLSVFLSWHLVRHRAKIEAFARAMKIAEPGG